VVVPSDELMTLKLRFKQPEAAESSKIEISIRDSGAMPEQASADYQFAAAVAVFGMILRDSPYKGGITLDRVLDLAGGSVGEDADGKRAEFVTLVEAARTMTPLATNPK
jgi:Ca-activated chloride channel family protein